MARRHYVLFLRLHPVRARTVGSRPLIGWGESDVATSGSGDEAMIAYAACGNRIFIK
jgi:hypothetical protein